MSVPLWISVEQTFLSVLFQMKTKYETALTIKQTTMRGERHMQLIILAPVELKRCCW